MQKSEISEDKAKAKSKNNTPKKNSSIKNIKSPIRVIKKEIPENSSITIKPKPYKNITKNDFFENDNRTNIIANTNLKKNKLEAEISINNLLNNNNFINNSHYKKNDLNISPSENINKDKFKSEMLSEKNIKERSKKNMLINIINFPTNNLITEQTSFSNEIIKNESEQKNLMLENKADSNVNSKNGHNRDLKIESNIKKIIPPNNLNNFKESVYIKEIEKNEDLNNLNIKYEDNNSNLDDLEYIKLSNAKKKKEWKSWSLSEKELFYEAIANGANYTSLQKLFKNMNDVRDFIF